MVCSIAHPEVVKQGLSYEQVKHLVDSGDSKMVKCRKQTKSVVFGTFYYATKMAVARALGVSDEEAQEVLDRMCARYPGIREDRAKVESAFVTADTEGWSSGCISKMADTQTDLTGYTRNWKFEKSVAETLWEIAKSGIKTGMSGSVVRKQEKGRQSYDMAVVSACYGSAIAIQNAVARQAGNMKIQATGSSLTKMLMATIWNRLRIPTLNIHDELFPPHHPFFKWDSYSSTVDLFVGKTKKLIPTLNFDYSQTEKWSDK